jgi:hypothetical protein
VKGILFAAILAASATTLAHADDSPAVESVGKPSVGDEWTYEVNLKNGAGERNNIWKVTATEVLSHTIVTKTEISEMELKPVVIFDQFWNVLTGPDFRYSPNDGQGIRAILEVSKEWSFENNGKSLHSSDEFHRSGSSRVVRKETLTTKAGTFSTTLIETNIRSRQANGPKVEETINLKTWFCPDINRWVKRIYTRTKYGTPAVQTLELIEFKRAQPR